MYLNDLADLLGQAIDVPPGTLVQHAKRLRTARIFSTGQRGRGLGKEMTSRDSANLLLAGLIEHRYGGDVASDVRRVRSLPFANFFGVPREGFAGCLSFTQATTFGAALVALLDDLRSGLFARFESQDPRPLDISLTLDDANGEGFLTLMRRGDALAGNGNWVFRNGAAHGRPVWRQVHVRDDAFRNLATALGPPD